MIKADVIYLLSENPGAHGVFDSPTYTERMVYCTVRSVGMPEFYRAHEQGLEPSIVFVLTDAADYEGERIIRWGEGAFARYYKVIRTYVDGLAIEITCEEAEVYVTTDGAFTDN